ncbi:MAG TPA: hypothetical protein VK155_02165, partial [Bacteroidales bacterium]|nr:hypothetical protein [Bacteroidales bacterium]
LILDFMGCANFVWSKHTLDQREQMAIVQELMPSVRTRLNITRVPSREAGEIVPVSISSKFNAGKTGIFKSDLTSIKNGKVEKDGKIFNLETSGGKCVVAVGAKGKGENTLPTEVRGIAVNEDVSSLIFLHACALPSSNQKAYFNIPDFFDTSDLLGWYEIVYEDNYRISVPIQYGVNILEWNPGAEDRLDKMEGETGAAQNVYAYNADPVQCSDASAARPVTFFAFEWINPRFGKMIREVNVFGTINYQATGTDYGKPAYSPLKSNAIMLAGITKVKKTLPYVPKSE